MERNDNAPTSFCGQVFGLITFGLVVFLAAVGYGQGLGAAFAIFSFMVFNATKILKNSPSKAGEPFQFSPSRFIEKTETQIYLLLVVLLPIAFSAISAIFGLMCWVTAIARIWEDMKDRPSVTNQDQDTATQKPQTNIEASENNQNT